MNKKNIITSLITNDHKHSEHKCLDKFKNKIDQADTIVSIRINIHQQTLASGKPCIHCLYLIKKSGIKNIIYSLSNGELVKEQTKEVNSIQLCKGKRFKYRKNKIE